MNDRRVGRLLRTSAVRISAFLCALLILVSVCVPAFASYAGGDYMKVNDHADLMSSSDVEKLEQLLEEVSEKHQCDVLVLTVDSLNGYTPNGLADDYFDYGGFGYGSRRTGILFLLAMEERDWAISTTGDAIDVFTDAGQEYMTKKIVPYMSRGDYADGFTRYAKLCDQFLTQAENGDPYDIGNMPKENFFFQGVGISAVIGAIISFITTAVMKSKLKTVRPERTARAYLRPGSFELGIHSDVFLYDRVTRVRKPKEPSGGSGRSGGGGSTIHMGSSGTTHGGSHGKF